MLHYQGLAQILLVCGFSVGFHDLVVWFFYIYIFFFWCIWFSSILFVHVIMFGLTLYLRYLLCHLNYNVQITFFLSLGNCPQSRQSCRNHFRRKQKWTSVCQWKTRSCCGSYRMETWAVHARSLPLPPPWLCSPLATQAFSPAPLFLPDNISHQLPGSSFSNTLPGTVFVYTEGYISCVGPHLVTWRTLIQNGYTVRWTLYSWRTI